jgi:hypothetical protein
MSLAANDQKVHPVASLPMAMKNPELCTGVIHKQDNALTNGHRGTRGFLPATARSPFQNALGHEL